MKIDFVCTVDFSDLIEGFSNLYQESAGLAWVLALFAISVVVWITLIIGMAVFYRGR